MAYGWTRNTTFTVSPDSNGDRMTVYVPAGVAYDRASNPNAVSNSLEIIYDQYLGLPTVDLHSADAGKYYKTNASPYTVTATFSEPVWGFSDASVAVTGGAVTSATEDDSAAAYGAAGEGAKSFSSDAELNTDDYFTGMEVSSRELETPGVAGSPQRKDSRVSLCRC
eukprot:4372606-Pyramimonas_sp.AAC.1